MPVFTLASENRTTVINRAISDIRKQGSAAVNKDLFDVYANNYFKGISSVFSDIDSNSPLFEKLQQYKLNAANFAAHKSYMVTDKLRAAKDDAEIKSIVNKFNRYQSAEYNTMVARSRTAKQWDTFESEKHLFPNLEWIRTRSANPRELHLGYVGIILPINDAFWQQNQPGNLWNCKCDWKTTDAQPTAKPTKITPAATGLDGNPYETGKLITEKHPYFKVTAEAKKQIKQFVNQNTYERVYQNDNIFVDVSYAQGKLERKKNTNASVLLAEYHKESTTLLPVSTEKGVISNDAIRHKYNNEWDYKILEGNNTKTGVQNAIKNSKGKENVIIFLKKNDYDGLIAGLETAFQEGRAKIIKLVDIYTTDNKLYRLTVNEIKDKSFIDKLKTHKATR